MFVNKNFEANICLTLKRRGKATDVMSVPKSYLRHGDFFLSLLLCMWCTSGVPLVLIIICISLVVAISKAGWIEINLQT